MSAFGTKQTSVCVASMSATAHAGQPASMPMESMAPSYFKGLRSGYHTQPLRARLFISAEKSLHSSLKGGDLVAELKFAFWVGLLGPHYDATLWRKALYKGFLARGGKPRSTVHNQFNALRRFRNRVMHHEPIFRRPLFQLHDEIIEAIEWMWCDTAAWTAHHSRFPTVHATTGAGAAAAAAAVAGIPRSQGDTMATQLLIGTAISLPLSGTPCCAIVLFTLFERQRHD